MHSQAPFQTPDSTMAGAEQLLNFFSSDEFTPSAPQMLNNSPISLFVSLKSWKLSNKRERETTHPQSSSEGFVSWLGFWKGKAL